MRCDFVKKLDTKKTKGRFEATRKKQKNQNRYKADVLIIYSISRFMSNKPSISKSLVLMCLVK